MPTWLVQQTFDQAQTAMECGRITQDAWEAFYFLWCGLVPRFGNFPTCTWSELDDQVQTIVLMLAQAHAIVAQRSVPSILERLGVTL